jgi:hypothetical protein
MALDLNLRKYQILRAQNTLNFQYHQASMICKYVIEMVKLRILS